MRRYPAAQNKIAMNVSFLLRRTHTPDPQLPDDVCKDYGGFPIAKSPDEMVSRQSLRWPELLVGLWSNLVSFTFAVPLPKTCTDLWPFHDPWLSNAITYLRVRFHGAGSALRSKFDPN